MQFSDTIPLLEEALRLARQGDLRTLLLCYDSSERRITCAGDPLTIIGHCELAKSRMMEEARIAAPKQP